MKLLLIDFGSGKNPRLAALLRRRGHTVHVVDANNAPREIAADVVILGGSRVPFPRAVNALETFPNLRFALRHPRVLGICYGHQLLHTWMRGTVTELPRKVNRIKCVFTDPGHRSCLRGRFSHRYVVTQPAPGSRAIAWDRHLPVAYRIGSHVTAQFHLIESSPELRNFVLHQAGL